MAMAHAPECLATEDPPLGKVCGWCVVIAEVEMRYRDRTRSICLDPTFHAPDCLLVVEPDFPLPECTCHLSGLVLALNTYRKSAT